MFGKKYVFETKATRTKRFILNASLVLVLLTISFSTTCLFLPYYAKNQNELSAKAFYQKSPDLISVYTGDTGRLEYTFKTINKHPSSKVLISGVYAKNSLATLLNKQGKEISVEEYINKESHHIELDYLARNTVENVLSTIRYLNRLKDHDTALIISNDYHIFRIKLILDKLKGKETHHKFYLHGIKTDYSKVRNIKILFKEVYKLFKTWIFLFFWS